jgi:methionine biosynthesis protein MetW
MRPDLEFIATLIPAESRVLDIGCGNAKLLEHLITEKKVRGQGIELDAGKVAKAVARGVPVVQGDADHDLSHYPDKSFGYAILGQTLQATKDPKKVLEELLRVATYAVVSIPNFGHWRNRTYLGLKGRMPVTESLSYQWYETPNIHFCTVQDFSALCKEVECEIVHQYYMKKGKVLPFKGKGAGRVNLTAEEAIFVLKRG